MNKQQDSPRLRRRTVWLRFLPLPVAMVIALVLFDQLVRGPRTSFGDAALGEQTFPYFAEVGATPIHCRGLERGDEMIAAWEKRGRREVMLWLGNSQIHAINQRTQGQETAAPELFRRFDALGVEFLSSSLPNASVEEHYTLFAYLTTRLPVKTIVLPVVFDDLREGSVRPPLLRAMKDPQTAEYLSAGQVGKRLLAMSTADDFASGEEAATEETKGVKGTVQERSEQALNRALERRSERWRKRPEARGRLYLGLYQFRNWLFRISAQSKRKMINENYTRNMSALRELLQRAQADGIRVLAYVPPLRNDVETPYVKEEYAAFKEEFRRLAGEYRADFRDWENLVPNDLWGMQKSSSTRLEYDFMHFQEPGHRLLAGEIGRVLEEALPLR